MGHQRFCKDCHPFCLKNPVQEWSGETSRDQVHYLSGWISARHFLHWIKGVGYDLEIGRAGGRTSYVSWRIQSTSDESCVLRIVVYPFLLQHLPVGVRWIPHFTYVGPLLSKYLSSVVRGFEWFVIGWNIFTKMNISTGNTHHRQKYHRNFHGHWWFMRCVFILLLFSYGLFVTRKVQLMRRKLIKTIPKLEFQLNGTFLLFFP